MGRDDPFCASLHWRDSYEASPAISVFISFSSCFEHLSLICVSAKKVLKEFDQSRRQRQEQPRRSVSHTRNQNSFLPLPLPPSVQTWLLFLDVTGAERRSKLLSILLHVSVVFHRSVAFKRNFQQYGRTGENQWRSFHMSVTSDRYVTLLVGSVLSSAGISLSPPDIKDFKHVHEIYFQLSVINQAEVCLRWPLTWAADEHFTVDLFI